MMPSKQTLNKYGLTSEDWQALYDKFNGACHVCRRIPGGKGILFVEHEHVRGYSKMLPGQKKKYIRGLACYICNNKLLQKGITKGRLLQAAQYLDEYEKRKSRELFLEQKKADK